MKVLSCCSCPKNIRELSGVTESYPIMLAGRARDGKLRFDLLGERGKDGIVEEKARARRCPSRGTKKESLDETRALAVENAIERCSFNRGEVARQQGIGCNTLWRVLSGEDGAEGNQE